MRYTKLCDCSIARALSSASILATFKPFCWFVGALSVWTNGCQRHREGVSSWMTLAGQSVSSRSAVTVCWYRLWSFMAWLDHRSSWIRLHRDQLWRATYRSNFNLNVAGLYFSDHFCRISSQCNINGRQNHRRPSQIVLPSSLTYLTMHHQRKRKYYTSVVLATVQ